jgi:hypothetical protein
MTPAKDRADVPPMTALVATNAIPATARTTAAFRPQL